ncbi:hypothetical protein Vadar_030920 [Vaccinium darrowii]|uniref:Uncharacterized protein n=1 Tax=Vaccinium darrowii TaxID=229202 RepID=A0ACB7XDI5_9ERIC|nr:hypothetical protein Vadar_030920 [Vaccinium darrowii]
MSSRSNSDLSYPSSSPNSGSENETANSGRRRGKRNRRVYFSDERRRKSGRIRKPAVDLFSALPDSLLVHVLSFLPIVYAVRTQVLSKRWQCLWTYTTSLVFRIDDGNSPGNGKSDDEFVAFVDKTLSLCNCSKIKKFGVQFVYESEYLSNVDMWTELVTAKGVEEFQLDFDCAFGEVTYSNYWLPQLLYTNSSFKVLQFNQCYVMPEGVVSWNSLKKLSIGNAVLSEDLIQKILAGSPVLEILELYCLFGFNRLHVSNASMKKLILRDICEEGIVPEEYQIFNFADYSVLEISAPHLHSLEISGAFENKICQLGDVSSLVDAKLNFHVTGYEDYCDIIEVFENMLKGLLQSLVHGKKITLGNWAIKLLSIMELKGLRSPLLKCECLTLEAGIRKSFFPGIAHMLESSPNLDTLVISVPSSSYDEDEEYFPDQLCKFDGKNYWTSRKKPFTCLMFRLQKVRFLGFRQYEVGNKLGYYLSFVRFLLKNARVLQKMVINAEIVGCNSQKEFSRAAQKLLSFPRSSPDAVVMFYE